MSSNFIVLNCANITFGQKSGTGLKKIQAELLGVPYPLRQGWKKGLNGKSVRVEIYDLFVSYGRI
jgi:hypothetical protein